jgi:dTDP-4-amino-4,6-dideoxygalactose transaminase
VGRNSRLDALQAGFLSAKLPYLDRWNDGRRALATEYRRLLKGVSGFTLSLMPPEPEAHCYHQLVGLVDETHSRPEVQARMADEGVETGIHYPLSLHRQPAFARWSEDCTLPMADHLADRQLSLPMDPLYGPETAERVVAALTKALRARK